MEGSKNALCNLLQNIFFFSSIFCENISGKLAVLKYKWTVIMFTLLKHSFMFDFLSFHNKTNKNIKSNHINFILDATRNYHLSICYSDLYLHWFYPVDSTLVTVIYEGVSGVDQTSVKGIMKDFVDGSFEPKFVPCEVDYRNK